MSCSKGSRVPPPVIDRLVAHGPQTRYEHVPVIARQREILELLAHHHPVQHFRLDLGAIRVPGPFPGATVDPKVTPAQVERRVKVARHPGCFDPGASGVPAEQALGHGKPLSCVFLRLHLALAVRVWRKSA